MSDTTKQEIESDPQFAGLVFDEDEEEKANPSGNITADLWYTGLDAFQLFNLGRRYPDVNGNPDASVLLACIKEREIRVEDTLLRISEINQGFLLGKK